MSTDPQGSARIRLATGADAPAIAAIYNQGIAERLIPETVTMPGPAGASLSTIVTPQE